jgi:ligand-binding sensor domain-containing protein
MKGDAKASYALVYIGIIFLAVLGLTHIINSYIGSPSHEIKSSWQVIRPPHDVEALAIQGDIVWAGGQEGVIGVDRITGEARYNLSCNISPTYVQALLVDRNGSLWIGFEGGLIRYCNSGCMYYTKEDGLPDNRVQSLLEDRTGRIWAGTWNGAAVQNGALWRAITADDGLQVNMVNAMLEDSHGGMWFGSYVAPRGGISYLREGRWQYFNTSSGLPHNNINAIIEDSAGDVWAGTGFLDHGGAVKFVFNGSAWIIDEVVTVQDGLAGDKVRSLFQVRNGSIWFGSEYDGLAILKDGRFQVFSAKDGLSHPEVKCFAQDMEGNLWIGTRDGITHITAMALSAL